MEVIPGNIAFPYRPLHKGGYVAHPEIAFGKVQGHRHHGLPPIYPFSDIPADFFHHKAVQFVKLSAFLQNVHKLVRRQKSVLGIFPSGQGFRSAECPRQGSDLRLVIYLDPFLVDGLLNMMLHIFLYVQTILQIPGVLDINHIRVMFDGIAGHFCSGQEIFHIQPFGQSKPADPVLAHDTVLVTVQFPKPLCCFLVFLEKIFVLAEYGKMVSLQSGDHGIFITVPQDLADTAQTGIPLCHPPLDVQEFEVHHVHIDDCVFGGIFTGIFFIDPADVSEKLFSDIQSRYVIDGRPACCDIT